MAKKPVIALILTASFILLISLSQARSPSLMPGSNALDRKFGVDLTEVSSPKDNKILLPTEKLPQSSDSTAFAVNLEVEDKPEKQEIVSDEKNLPSSGSVNAETEEREPLNTAGEKHENVLEVRFRPMMTMPHHRHARWAWMTRRFWFPKRCGGGHRHHPGHGPLRIPQHHQGEETTASYHVLPVREINVPLFHHQMREGGEGMMPGEFKRPHFGFFHHHHHHHHHGHHDHDDEEFDEEREPRHHRHHHHGHEDGEIDEHEGREPHRKRFGMWRKMRKFIMTDF